MRAVGLITEYNPFHNGHLHHLQESRRLAGAEVAVAVMSGHFLQRGEPALVDKWTRTALALAAGVDVVLELPFPWACNSAPNFAAGAVRLLTACGGVESVCFGSESGDLAGLQQQAAFLTAHEATIAARSQALLRCGVAYPLARVARALAGDLHSNGLARVGAFHMVLMLYGFLTVVFIDLVRLVNAFWRFVPRGLVISGRPGLLFFLAVAGVIVLTIAAGAVNAARPRTVELEVHLARRAGSADRLTAVRLLATRGPEVAAAFPGGGDLLRPLSVALALGLLASYLGLWRWRRWGIWLAMAMSILTIGADIAWRESIREIYEGRPESALASKAETR